MASVLDVLELRLNNVAHLGTWLAGLVRREETVWAWNLNVGRHVTVRTRQRRCLDTCGGKLGLKSFALTTLFSLLTTTHLVTIESLPLRFSIFSRRQSLIEVLESLLRYSIFLLLLLLQFKCFRLEHGEFGNGGQHLAGKLSGSSLVLIDFLGDFKRILTTVESLSAKFLSQLAHLFIDKFLLKKSFLLVVQALFEDVNLG